MDQQNLSSDVTRLLQKIEQLEKENQLIQSHLRSAATMISLGELLSTTTHEFNNMLMTVMNYARMGLRHSDNETREKALTIILNASNRAAQISESVLGMARNRSVGKEATDLVQLTEAALLLLEREMNKYRIQVDTDFSPNVPEVFINGNQIQEVLLNLLTNARQAMEKTKGRLLIKIHYDAASQMVDLVVRDYGAGIATDVLPHIFDPFFSTKSGPDDSGKGGTGLGLSRCREIMEDHHGRILVQSTPGKGTAFTLKLPLAPNAKIPSSLPQEEIPARNSVSAPAANAQESKSRRVVRKV
ncbi:MAG: HAMP domain-containing sensor histidine kinase [Planctomycetia bacterium]|nr:HAMP domain-containing sensor histidine kinase [Planctomycetia bacterium]